MENDFYIISSASWEWTGTKMFFCRDLLVAILFLMEIMSPINNLVAHCRSVFKGL